MRVLRRTARSAAIWVLAGALSSAAWAQTEPPLPRPRPQPLALIPPAAPAEPTASADVVAPPPLAAVEPAPMEPAAAKFAATGAQSYFPGIPYAAGLIFDELESARIPRPRPGAPSAPVIEQASLPVAPPFFPSADEAACRRRLADLGVIFTPVEPIEPDGACHVRAPISVTSLGAGIALTPAAILNCRTTEALALWAQDVMAPAARTYLGAMPTEIRHASTYACRSRNNQAGARLSEHANANAVDIGSIAFAGREPIDVRARGASEAGLRDFQRTIRAGACSFFTTVLGPGSDAAHADHYHFDMAERRGGYRLCD